MTEMVIIREYQAHSLYILIHSQVNTVSLSSPLSTETVLHCALVKMPFQMELNAFNYLICVMDGFLRNRQISVVFFHHFFVLVVNVPRFEHSCTQLYSFEVNQIKNRIQHTKHSKFYILFDKIGGIQGEIVSKIAKNANYYRLQCQKPLKKQSRY